MRFRMWSEAFYVFILGGIIVSFVAGDCPWQGEVHVLGSTWNPRAFPCVNCSCITGTTGESMVRCVNEDCPKLNCSESKIRMDPGICCPYCEVTSEGDDDDEVPKPGCGQYNHGDVYANNNTGIKPNKDNQCVMCVCQNGKQLCHLKTCIIPPSCTSFINVSDDCCPQCADLNEISWDDPAFFESRADLLNTHLDEDDCLEGGSIRRNGTTWHPTVGSFGQIDCITCSCMNGEMRCRKDCVPEDKLPCPNPRKKSGQCCKQCPDHGTSDVTDVDENENKGGDKQKNRGRKGTKRTKCKKRKDGRRSKKCKGRKRKSKPTTPSPLTPTGIDLKNLCIPKRTEYLVYKSIGKTEVFLAFDNLEEGTAEVFRWTVSKGLQGSVVSSIDPEIVLAAEFRRQISNTNVVGTTGKNHYRKFKRRLKRKLKRCSDSCKPKSLISLLKRVKVHLLKFGEDCDT